MDSHRVERLRQIKSFPSLVKYLRDDLDWPLEASDFEELTFDYEPDELGIDKTNAAKIQEIKQLRPLAANQPYGIFFLKFEPKRLPVVVLRRILGQLVIKKRASGRRADQPAWHLNDLLFISNYGDQQQRQITFAQFAKDEIMGDLPVLRVLGWDDADTYLHLDHVDNILTEKLRWPKDDSDVEKWRTQWSSAFVLRHREVITTSKQLSLRLAELAKRIRNRAKLVLAVETERGQLRQLHKAFKESLIHDLTEDDFADMYAQTIAYGLLAARISRPAGLVADNLADIIPVTNPFLKELLEKFLKVGGRKGGFDFDELGVNEVVETLRDAKMEVVLRDFGDKNPQEDPVIHFYELFLKEYDAKKRIKRGVFYTPRPVVSYIVRSVDELLRTEFGLADGLADTTTWGEMAKRHKSLTIPEGVSATQAFVQILDPATGTGTFLVEVIDVIYKNMAEKWKRENRLELEFNNLWNEYVPKHLLPRLHGYELLMAPYAIAHLKIGIKLYETGYRFGSNERARVFLTNSLEPASDVQMRTGMVPALAHESRAVNDVKRRQRFTVVIGNPPYSKISGNMGGYIIHQLKTNLSELLMCPSFYEVDGAPIKERKVWLQDDYVKFLRIGQISVAMSGAGVLAFITNNGYLGNPTFNGMRQSLLVTFQRAAILNLHGDSNIGENFPDGGAEENVFDIQQGVAISVLSFSPDIPVRTVTYSDCWGTRIEKYSNLLGDTTARLPQIVLSPDSPLYLLVPSDTSTRKEFESAMLLPEIMPYSTSGIVTSKDDLVVGFQDSEVKRKINIFISADLSDEEVLSQLNLSENYAWKVSDARRQLQADRQWEKRFITIYYRPFDTRRLLYHPAVVWRMRENKMSVMLSGNNIGLLATRQASGSFTHVSCSQFPIEMKACSHDRNTEIFPFRISNATQQQLEWNGNWESTNISETFLETLAQFLGNPISISRQILQPENVFSYITAILHSPGYRRRYADQLKRSYPRIPLPNCKELFDALGNCGAELISLHLLTAPLLCAPATNYFGPETPTVERIGWSNDTVWLDAASTKKGQSAKPGTIGFHGVPEAVWNFHIGGYQVCEKWLKVRKGRTLSKEDITHYQKIVVALGETIRIMAEIDKVIDRHGGWPKAFQSKGKE